MPGCHASSKFDATDAVSGPDTDPWLVSRRAAVTAAVDSLPRQFVSVGCPSQCPRPVVALQQRDEVLTRNAKADERFEGHWVRNKARNKRQLLDRIAGFENLDAMNLGRVVELPGTEQRMFATFTGGGTLVRGLYSLGGLTMFLSRKEKTAWFTLSTTTRPSSSSPRMAMTENVPMAC